MAVKQRIYKTACSSRQISTPAVMFWAGDGHDHWHIRGHIRDIEAYRLIRLDNGRRVGTGAKHGFCYFDNTPLSALATGCTQLLDITGLKAGRYRLRAIADPANWFAEPTTPTTAPGSTSS